MSIWDDMWAAIGWPRVGRREESSPTYSARTERPASPGSSLSATFIGLRSDYAAASRSRFRRDRQTPAQGAHADYHYRSEGDYLRMQELARDMDRNDQVVGQAIDRATDNILGDDGFRLDPNTGDQGLDADLLNRWHDWADNPRACDRAGEHTFTQLTRLALRDCFVAGDILAVGQPDGTLAMVESHRIRTPNELLAEPIVHGVEMDANRKRIAYYIAKEEIETYRSTGLRRSESIRVPAFTDEGLRVAFHLYNPKRTTQTRGVTALAPIMDACGMFEDIQFARLVQQQIVSCWTILAMRDANTGFGKAPKNHQYTDTSASGFTRLVERLSPGMKIVGDPGEKLSGFSPNIPPPSYFEFARMVLQLIAINLGMPVQMLLLDASDTNFSGWRGAVDQARIGFKVLQKQLSCRWHSAIYQWQVYQWAADDAALADRLAENPRDVLRHRWHGRRWPYIEPLKDASAKLLRLRNGLDSPRRIHAEDGVDYGDHTREKIEDLTAAIREAKKAAATINQEFPDDSPVDWRELLNAPTPDGVKVTVGTDGAEQTETRRDDRDSDSEE